MLPRLPVHPFSRHGLYRAALAASLVLLVCGAAGVGAVDRAGPTGGPPQDLRDTGLYAAGTAPDGTPRLHAGLAAFTPQYPLWSDGADKRRWVALPPRTAIDARRPDAWQFPPGTRLWKQFSHGGRPVETRFIERKADGRWRYASYVWNEAGTAARLVPPEGLRGLLRQDAPDGRYDIPSQDDCRACHESAAVPVLGLGALQLSADRDPLAVAAGAPAPSDVDLQALADRGWLRHLPPALLKAAPPRIPAATPLARAALGTLHANCGHCHNASGQQAPVALRLAQSVAAPEAGLQAVLRSLLHTPARSRPDGASTDAAPLLPGRPEASLLLQRMHSRRPAQQMPPLGTRLPDAQGLDLVTRWVRDDLAPPFIPPLSAPSTLVARKETPP